MYTLYFAVFLISSLLFSEIQAQTYRLDTSYSGSTFFQGFDFFTDSDPTHGFVSYVSASAASSGGLAGIARNGATYIGVDYRSQLSPSGAGRKSVRITSKKSWTHGLFIADIAHMPGGICGTWPAFWTLGPNWPLGGEIDIIEGVNSQKANSMSLHTSPNCMISQSPQLGTLVSSNCDGNVNQNAGCTTTATSAQTYGNGFNAGGGGVYAMEWTSNAIKIWFFPRSSVPANIKSGKPVTSGWGTPLANNQGCDIDSHFKNHKIVFDTTFCGDWAANVWQNDATCKALAGSCNDYVAANPSAFRDAYWSVNSVKVYTSTSSVHIESVDVGDASDGPLGGKTAVVVTNGTKPIEVAPSEQQRPMDSSSSETIPEGSSSAGYEYPIEGSSAPDDPLPADLPLDNPSPIDPPQNKSSAGTAPNIVPAYQPDVYSPLYSPDLDSPSCDAQSKLASADAQLSGVSASAGGPDSSSDASIFSPFSPPSQGTENQDDALIPLSAVAIVNDPKQNVTRVQPAGALAQILAPSGAKLVGCDGTSGSSSNEKRVVVGGPQSPAIVGGTAAKRVTTNYKKKRGEFLPSSDSVATDPSVAVSSSTTLPSDLATTTPSSLPTTHSSSSSGYIYLGCFTVNEENLKLAWDSQWSYIDACFSTCTSLSKPIAALSGSKCFCGVTGDLGILASNAECDTPCPGNLNTICGGDKTQAKNATLGSRSYSGGVITQNVPSTVSLYQRNQPLPVADKLAADAPLSNDEVELLYEGCYLFAPTSEPNFQFRFSSPTMTRQECLINCTGFPYAGLFLDQCYCGLYVPADEEYSCTFKCPGDPTTECGGVPRASRFALSVFSNPYYTSGQLSDAIPAVDNTPVNSPATFNFAYAGCYSYTEGLTNFGLIFQSYAMTHQLCFSKCPSSLLAGIHSTGCYCGGSLKAPAQGNSDCALPCPGDMATQCGGGKSKDASLTVFKREPGSSISGRALSLLLPHGSTRNSSTGYSTSYTHQSSHKSSSSDVSVHVHNYATFFNSPSQSSELSLESSIRDQDTSQSDSIPEVSRREVVLLERTPSASDSSTPGSNAPFQYNGCYGLYTITNFVLMLSEYSITQPLCANTCSNNGSAFAGMHGQDCYCGSGVTASPSKEQDCDFPCAADPATFCGGFSPPSITVLKIEQPSGSKPYPPKDAAVNQKPAGGNGDPKKLPLTIDIGGTYNIYITHNPKPADDGTSDADNNGEAGDDNNNPPSIITSCPCTETHSPLATAALPSNPQVGSISNISPDCDSSPSTDFDPPDDRKKLDDTSFAIDSVLPTKDTSVPSHSIPGNVTHTETCTSQPPTPISTTLSPSTPAPITGPTGQTVTGNGNGLRFRGVGMSVWGVVLAWMVFWGLVGVVVGDWVFVDTVVRV